MAAALMPSQFTKTTFMMQMKLLHFVDVTRHWITALRQQKSKVHSFLFGVVIVSFTMVGNDRAVQECHSPPFKNDTRNICRLRAPYATEDSLLHVRKRMLSTFVERDNVHQIHCMSEFDT